MRTFIAIACVLFGATAARADDRWLAISATSEARQYDAERGLRAEADLLRLQGWVIGAAAAYGRGTVGVYGDLGADLRTHDVEAISYVARAARFERWELRGALGAGAIYTSASGEAVNGPRMEWVADRGLFPAFEASVRATVPISPHWAVTAGSVATYLDQYFHLEGGTTHREAQLVFQLGLALRR